MDVPFGAPPPMTVYPPPEKQSEEERRQHAMMMGADPYLVDRKNFNSWLESAPASQNIENRTGDPRWDPPRPEDSSPTLRGVERSTAELKREAEEYADALASAFVGGSKL